MNFVLPVTGVTLCNVQPVSMLQHAGQMLDPLGLRSREIMLLARVAVQVEEHPVPSRRRDELVTALDDDADGAIVRLAESLHEIGIDPLLGEDRALATAVERRAL